METKTHYRNVFKSDHLGVADLEDMIEKKEPLYFKVKEVKQEYGVKVAGREGDHNIAYFEGNHKPLVLNATNSKIMKKFSEGSSFIEDWNNKWIELYIDPNVTMKGEKVGGVRIRPVQPVMEKPELTPDHKRWEAAKKAAKDGRLDAVLKQFNISVENKKLLEA
ncbi:hypothetical protein [Flagellimonas flava]|uniref:hypothetical protein n=1 Tax=Flagellimonas flava TaxID=570519 RepID=UPI003D65410B